jgi:hypothetical protein
LGGATTTALASARRKPAITSLDKLPTLGRPALFRGQGNAIRALLGSNVYELSGKDWAQLTHFSRPTKARLSAGAVIFNVEQSEWAGEEMHLLRSDEAQPLFLAANWPQRQEARAKWAERRQQARFALPDGYMPYAHTMLNGNVTIAVHGMLVGHAPNGSEATFSFNIYDPKFSKPVVVPMFFDGMLPNGNGNFIVSNGRIWFAQTTDGLCMGLPDQTGFWRIPNADIERGIAGAVRDMNHRALKPEPDVNSPLKVANP